MQPRWKIIEKSLYAIIHMQLKWIFVKVGQVITGRFILYAYTFLLINISFVLQNKENNFHSDIKDN